MSWKSANHIRPKGKDLMGRMWFILITPDRFCLKSGKRCCYRNERAAQSFARMNGRHGGDIQGIKNSLDYLAEWVSPRFGNPVLKITWPRFRTTGIQLPILQGRSALRNQQKNTVNWHRRFIEKAWNWWWTWFSITLVLNIGGWTICLRLIGWIIILNIKLRHTDVQ